MHAAKDLLPASRHSYPAGHRSGARDHCTEGGNVAYKLSPTKAISLPIGSSRIVNAIEVFANWWQLSLGKG